MRSTRLVSVTLLSSMIAASLMGCATVPPPKELVDARESYSRASQGDAKDLAPAELDTAKKALGKAEAAFRDDPSDKKTKDQAYIADRKSLLAEAVAASREAEKRKLKAEADFAEFRDRELRDTRSALQKEKDRLEAEKRARENAEKGRDAAERGRADAEKALAAALASLKELGSIKEEKRGTVITLSGAVLFVTNKSDLLPIAREKLSQVSRALKEQGYPPLRVEGHTDSTGSAEENRKLSLARADSVKAQLVSEGYPSAKISTLGLGPDRPVAENGTPEGRANNRRVEIIVNPTGQ